SIQDCQARAIPRGEPGGVEDDHARRRRGGQCLLDRRRRRESGTQLPLPGKLHNQGVAVTARGKGRARRRDGSRRPNCPLAPPYTTRRASRNGRGVGLSNPGLRPRLVCGRRKLLGTRNNAGRPSWGVLPALTKSECATISRKIWKLPRCGELW